MNQGITILQDYSAGSNATTMLCMDAEKTFYRKYAFGADGDKLAEQLAWLRTQQDRLPLCDILQSSTEDGCCWYDMVYDPQAVGLFRYLHSNPVEKSTAILREVLDTLEEKLYRPTARPADMEKSSSTSIKGGRQPAKTAGCPLPAGADGCRHHLGQRRRVQNLHQLAWLSTANG